MEIKSDLHKTIIVLHYEILAICNVLSWIL